MARNIGDGRTVKVCDVCGGVDDHPRHEFAGTVPGVQVAQPPSQEAIDRLLEVAPKAERGRLLRELMDTTTGQRHRDCCREAGCPTGECDVLTAGAEDKRGADLLEHLMKAKRSGPGPVAGRDDIVWATGGEG